MELKSVDQLCLQNQVTVQDLAKKAGLEEERVVSIALGQWSPSTEEREKIAEVFNLASDQINWSHKPAVQHIYGQGPASE